MMRAEFGRYQWTYEATFREPPAVVMPCVPWLPVTILICADELCIGEYMAPHCSLDLRFRRASSLDEAKKAAEIVFDKLDRDHDGSDRRVLSDQLLKRCGFLLPNA
jgi:hypothetical protein